MFNLCAVTLYSYLSNETVGMQIKNWQVTFSYVANLAGALDLSLMSKLLVKNDVCAVTYRPADTSYRFKNKSQEVITGELGFTKDPFSSSASFVVTEVLLEEEFVTECVLSAMRMDVHEKHLRNNYKQVDFLRGYLGEHRLLFDDCSIVVHPSFKLYADGTIITHLQVVSTESAFSTEDFIDRIVNLYAAIPNDVCVEAAACRGYLVSFFNSASWRQRFRLFRRAKWAWESEAIVGGLLAEDSAGVSNLGLVSMNALSEKMGGQEGGDYHLKALAQQIQIMILSTAVQHIKTARFSPSSFGMPTVYLVNISDQPEYSSGFTESHRATFEKICNRSAVHFENSSLGSGLRPHHDYSMHISKSVILFALGSKHFEEGLRKGLSERDAIAHDKQIIAEFVLLLQARLLRWDDISLSQHGSKAVLSRLQIDVINLDRNLVDISNFGEINDLLRRAVVTLGLDKFAERVSQNSQVRLVEISEQNEQLTQRLGLSLTVLLGLLGIPALSDGLVKPIWDIACWWRPQRVDVADVFFFGTSTVLVLVIIVLVWKPIRWYSEKVGRMSDKL